MTRKVTPAGVLLAPASIPEDQWLLARREGIGGSDIPAITGLSPYTSAYELYLDKRGDLPEVPMPDGLARAARWGHLHEPLIAAEFTRQHGLRTRRVGLIRHETDRWRLASLDRQVLGCPDGPCGLEIKNRSAWKADEWGASGEPGGVPDAEALQTHWYIGVTGYDHFHVAVLINGNDDRYYRVDRDEDLLNDVIAMAAAFWQRVKDGDPPPVEGNGLPVLLSAMWPGSAGAELVLAPGEADSLLAQREQMIFQRERYATLADNISNQLRALLGDAETAVRDGRPVFTWKRNGPFTRRQFTKDHPVLAEKYTRLAEVLDTESLAADHPELYRQYRARVLRVCQEGPE